MKFGNLSLSKAPTPPAIQQPLYVQTIISTASGRPELDKINATSASKACACEECVLARQREQQEQIGGGGGGGGGPMAGPSSGRAMAGLMAYGGSGPTTSSSSGQQMMFCNGPAGVVGGGPAQTIEEQIKQIDRISKECDNSRKSLEAINRRLDDLNDEVRRYREFLGHEKTRRDPALYKTNTAEPLSAYNDSICRLIDSLTSQLTMEWNEKLRSIQTQTIEKG